jgi:ribosomal protein L10
MDRLLDELREQHDEVLQALKKKASLFVLAERDLRAREAAQIRADLSAVYEVLEWNRRDREPRLALLVR